MQTIKPAPSQLFCKADEAEEVTKSGFYIDTKRAEKPRTAEVINVGSGVKNFAQKDKIIYKSYSTTDLKLEGIGYFLVAEEDVLGTVIET